MDSRMEVPIFFFKLLLEVLNATVSPQCKSNCHHFSWVWVNKSLSARVATHVISKGFSFYWVINSIWMKDNKRNILDSYCPHPHVWGLFTLSRIFLTLKVHTHHCFLRKLLLTEHVGIVPTFKVQPFSCPWLCCWSSEQKLSLLSSQRLT